VVYNRLFPLYFRNLLQNQDQILKGIMNYNYNHIGDHISVSPLAGECFEVETNNVLAT
jgi:hypothetical protein